MTATAAALRLEPTLVRDLGPGLPTLLVRPNRGVPVATVDLWFRTGAADEPPEIGGISHFLEHMLFKGTASYGPGEIERQIESVGGMCNAGTSYDFTHYYLTIPSASVARGVEMLAEMALHSRIDPEELEKERLVILEEWRRKQDNPGAMLYEDAYGELFQAGPYHRPVIGSEETIRSITREGMADYYRRRYAPEAAALVVAGDVDVDRLAELARAMFAGGDKAFDPAMRNPEPVRLARGGRHHREHPTGGELYLALTCAAPGFEAAPEEIVALDVAQFVVGQGRASILYQEIKEERGLASTIGCHYTAMRKGGMFLVSATCEPAKRAELVRAVDERLRRFASEPIPADQLERARRLLASAHLFSFETTGGATSEVGYYNALTGGTEFLDRYLERLEAVTGEAARGAVARLLEKGGLLEISVGPEN